MKEMMELRDCICKLPTIVALYKIQHGPHHYDISSTWCEIHSPTYMHVSSRLNFLMYILMTCIARKNTRL